VCPAADTYNLADKAVVSSQLLQHLFAFVDPASFFFWRARRNRAGRGNSAPPSRPPPRTRSGTSRTKSTSHIATATSALPRRGTTAGHGRSRLSAGPSLTLAIVLSSCVSAAAGALRRAEGARRGGLAAFLPPRTPGAGAGAAAPGRLRGGALAPLMAASMAEPVGIRLIDTCVNLQDSMFQGIYNDKQKHEPDWEHIMERAAATGVVKMIGVSGSLDDSRQSIAVAKAHPNVYATVGVHPTRCNEFDESGDADAHLEALRALVEGANAGGWVERTPHASFCSAACAA
jgi:hypothetical protein